MSTAIRSKPINGADCPVKEEGCWEPRNSFEITVEKKGMGEARPVYVHIFNLEPGEELLIERIYTSRCDPLYSPLRCQGKSMALSSEYPDTVLTMPGTYRFSTASGNDINNEDFAYEKCEVHPEYAELWLQQQMLCCCNSRGY